MNEESNLLVRMAIRSVGRVWILSCSEIEQTATARAVPDVQKLETAYEVRELWPEQRLPRLDTEGTVMPKITKHPRLRSLKRTNKAGKVTVYYAFDMRPEGKPDIQLGKDWNVAIVKWDELFNKKPRVKGTIEEAFSLFEEQRLPEYSGETHRMYAKALRYLRPVFGKASFESVKLPHLIKYMEVRKGKTQANREVSFFQVVWNFARMKGLTEIVWPAAGMKSAGWKNKEQPRRVRVSDEVFSAIYAEGDQLLRDAMDLASATGMRVTDVRTVPLPHGDVLHLDAHKTGMESDFDLALSTVLPDLIKRRRENKKAEHLMLLAGPFKKPVTYWHLNERFSKARANAAKKAREAGDEQMALAVEQMILRDCRKMASNLAGSLEEASQLLQHTNTATTRRHYRTKVDTLKPVR